MFAASLLFAFLKSEPVKVFIFAGQSNMVGSHSRVQDIKLFPAFAGLDKPQENVLYSYNLGREDKQTSNGWVALQPSGTVFGPELSFANKVARETKSQVAIIKCAAGGTGLGDDWNPDSPAGFKLYPIALQLVRSSLAELDRKKIAYRVEGFMWHQGENDMFNKEFKPKYEENLKNFLARWRRDLNLPKLNFYIGELCTKTIWGMDNRENMLAIRTAQKAVADLDPQAEYVRTNHNAVEIGDSEGLHYHYGTLGQLQHGVNYANAYLKSVGKLVVKKRSLKSWPYRKSSPIKLFIMAGHRNMEGERAFVDHLRILPGLSGLMSDNHSVAFKYSLGGGSKTSNGWEPLGPTGFYQTFGPELSFARRLNQDQTANFAIAKFTHSGSQINDWTPEGTAAKDLHLYPGFIKFVKEAIREINAKGHSVEVEGIFYHLGENDMAYRPYQANSVKWLRSLITASRADLGLPKLRWIVSQQKGYEANGLKHEEVVEAMQLLAKSDSNLTYLSPSELPVPTEKLTMDTMGIVQLGERLAKAYSQR